jgi:predicted nuclease with TOPRIM domain
MISKDTLEEASAGEGDVVASGAKTTEPEVDSKAADAAGDKVAEDEKVLVLPEPVVPEPVAPEPIVLVDAKAADPAGDKAAAPTEFNKNYITPFAKTLEEHEALMDKLKQLEADIDACTDALLAMSGDALKAKNDSHKDLVAQEMKVIQDITEARTDLVGKKDAIAQLLSDFSNKATKFVDEKTKFDTHNTAQTGLKEARASKEAEVNAKKDALDQIAKPDSALEAVDAKFGKKFADFLETLLNKKYSEQQEAFYDYGRKNPDMDNKYKAEHKKLTDDYNAAAKNAKDELEAATSDLNAMAHAAVYPDEKVYDDAVTEFKQDADKLSTFDMTKLSDGEIEEIINAIGDNHTALLSGLTLGLADKDNFSDNANDINAALVKFDTYAIATLGEVPAEVI